MPTDNQALSLDLALPADSTASIPTTPTGDIALASGRPNLTGALGRRMRSDPGALLHRPEYGVGLVSQVESPNTPAGRGLLAARARRNLLADPRISEARVSVRPGLPGETYPSLTPHAVTISADVTVRHDGSSATLSAALET